MMHSDVRQITLNQKMRVKTCIEGPKADKQRTNTEEKGGN